MPGTAVPALDRDERADGPMGSRFADALTYATRTHAGQQRRGEPYVAHLLRVAGFVIEDGGSEDEAIGALLHDAAEDQGGRPGLEDIRRRFGADVAAIVHDCTDSYGDPLPPWRERKQAYLDHLQDASPGALRVSAADKVDNVRSILRDLGSRGRWSDGCCGSEDALWYYRAVASVLARRHPSPRTRELSRLVTALRRRLAEERPQLDVAARR